MSEEDLFVRGDLPTVIIIGVMKSGTSSLHNYLGQHPQVQMSQPKELNFFVSDDDDPVHKGVQGRNYDRGLEWYRKHFDAAMPVRGESSPAYMDPGHAGAAERMVKIIPSATLIVLTRDPFDRAVSHFHHEASRGREGRTLEEALRDPHSKYVEMSRYHECLVPFYERFRPEQILRYHQRDLHTRRREVVADIFARLGVDATVEIENLEFRFNTAVGRESLLHRLLMFGRGSKLRSLVAKVLPKSIRYHIDARSRAVNTSEPTGGFTSNLQMPPMLREQFEALVRDDVLKFEQDFAEGRLIEGLPAV